MARFKPGNLYKSRLASVRALLLVALLFGVLWIARSGHEPASADHETEPQDQTVYTVNFSADEQSKWGLDDAVNLDRERFPIIGTEWNVADPVNGTDSVDKTQSFGDDINFRGFTIPVPDATFGGSITLANSGEIGLDAVYRDFTTGELAIDYPVEFTLSTPKKDDFRPGDPISISASYRLLPGWSFDTKPPDAGALDLVGTMGLSASADVRLCIFECEDLSPAIPSVNLPTSEETLVTVDTTDRIPLDTLELAELLLSIPPTDPFFDSLELIIGAPNVQFIKDNGYGVGAAALATYLGNFTAVGHFGGFLSLPSVQTDDSRDGDKLKAEGTHNFVNTSIDLDGITSDVLEAKLRISIPTLDFTLYDICVDGNCVSFGYDTLDVKTVVKLFQTEKYTFDPTPRVKLEFPQPVPFVVQDCDPLNPFNYYDPSNPNRVGQPNKTVVNSSAVNPPLGPVPPTPSGEDIMVPENWLICAGTSDIVVINADDEVEIIYPIDAHIMAVTPTFLLPNLVSNDTSNRFEQSLVGTAALANFAVSGFEIVSPKTLQGEICVDLPFGGEECTPEIRFDGLDFGGISLALGPLFTKTIPLFEFSDTDMFDIDREPWVMGGFNSPTETAFTLDAEIQPVARITGPNAQNRLNEGQEGIFSCATSQDDDIGEDIGVNVECRWDFDDGLTAVGTVVPHTFADNGSYDVELIVDDGHGLTDDDTLTITVDNVDPTVSARADKTVDEGSPAGLGLDLFGRNLLDGSRAEGGTSDWSSLSGGFSTTPYSPSAEDTVSGTNTIGVQLIENRQAEDGTSGWSASGTFLVQAYGNTDEASISTLIGPNIIKNEGAEQGLAFWTGDGHVRDYLPCAPTSDCPRDSGRGYADTGDYFQAVSAVTVGQTRSWSFIGWYDAKLEAEARTRAGFSGHLATFHSDAEINFVRDAVPNGAYDRWIGGFQPDHCCESHAGWAWVTGESFNYTNWASGEPNGGTQEDHARFTNLPCTNCGQWNDENAGVRESGYVVQFGASNSHTLPTNHRDRQFFGGYNDPSNSLTQIINVSGVGELIDAGQISFDFSGWLGGGGRDPDYATVLLRFRNSAGTQLGATHQLGPVFRFTRDYKTGMIPVATSGSVPTGTRDVEVVIQTTRNSEHHDPNNSAQVDELSLTFNAPGVNLNDVTVERFPTKPSDDPNEFLTSFFHAGSQPTTTASQSRDISGAAVLIDEGQVNYDLRGYLGGFDSHDDRATLRVRFKNSAGGIEGTATIVSATPGERGGATELQLRTDTGTVPAGTRSVDIDLIFERSQGVTNDGYADNLSLVLTAPGVILSGVPVGGNPKLNSPQGPANRELRFFAGSASVASASQSIDVSDDGVARLIDDNDATFSLEGFLGGFANQSDSGIVTATFQDAPEGNTLGTAQIGPVSATDRSGITGLVFRSAAGAVPFGTRSIEVTAKLQRSDGTRNDGTLDNLSLVLLAPSGANFTDPGRLDGPFTAQLFWGDGESEPGFVNEAEGVGSVVASHIYDDDGTYDVSVVITDKDSGQDDDGFQVIVLNVPPIVSALDNIFADEVEGTRLVATFDDPGANDGPFEASIDWGDGRVTAGAVDQDNKRVTGTHEYDETGQFPKDIGGSVTVTDKDDDSTTAFFTITLVNVRLQSVEAGNNSGLSIDEGESVTPSGTFQTVAPGVPIDDLRYEYTWDFGDFTSFGPVDLGVIAADNVTRGGLTAPAHTYGDDGQSVVTLTVNAFEGDRLATAESDSFIVTIDNADPIVEAVGGSESRSVAEGGAAAINPTSFTDAGESDIHTATIDWGDLTSLVAGVVDQAANTVSGDHVYADDGDYTVTVTVKDDDGGTGVDTFEYDVSNAAPVVPSGGGQSATEGDVVALDPVAFSDGGAADTHTATIDWGDGPPEPGTVNRVLRQVTGTHVYADDDTYNVEVCVTDDEGDNGCGERTITVANALPVVSAAGTRSAEEGELVFVNSTFTDKGSGDTHSATIDWGDLTPLDTGDVDPLTKSVTGNHRYSDDDDYTVTVTVLDDNGGPGSGNFEVVVTNVPVEIVSLQLTSVEPVFIEGKPVDLKVIANDNRSGSGNLNRGISGIAA